MIVSAERAVKPLRSPNSGRVMLGARCGHESGCAPSPCAQWDQRPRISDWGFVPEVPGKSEGRGSAFGRSVCSSPWPPGHPCSIALLQLDVASAGRGQHRTLQVSGRRGAEEASRTRADVASLRQPRLRHNRSRCGGPTHQTGERKALPLQPNGTRGRACAEVTGGTMAAAHLVQGTVLLQKAGRGSARMTSV